MNRMDQRAALPETLARASRAGAIGIAATAGALAVCAIVLHDADWFAVRDKWETFKIAMLGEWTPSGADDRPIVNVFRDMAHVAVFRDVPIEGTGISVVTGSRYISAADLLSGRATRLWCYVNTGGEGVATHIELGTQNRGEIPVFASLGNFSSPDLPASMRDGPSLERLARSHCRFNEALSKP